MGITLDIKLTLRCFEAGHSRGMAPLSPLPSPLFAFLDQDGTIVNDVQLPPWANGPADFILKHRAALEVSESCQNGF